MLTRFKKSKEGTKIGISLSSDRVSVCVTVASADSLKVSHCVSAQGEKSQAELLQKLINDHAIPKAPVTLVLSVEDHHIHKLARPSVEKSELKQSVKWLLKDRLVYGLEESIIETVDYPPGCQQDEQLMAIETSLKKIQHQVDIINEVGLEIDAIDISELLLGELLQTYPGIEQGLALVLDHNEGASLLIFRGEHLYLIRQLTGIKDFIACLPSESNMMMADALLLEIQRTLDYYDAQMRQPPLAGILLAPSFADITPLAEYLNKNLSINVECLDINQRLNLPEPLSPASQQDCLTACAAAFRSGPG